MRRYLIDRLQEPSTWQGFVLLLTGLGITVSPETAGYIIAAGTSTAGLIGVLTKENRPK